MKYPKVIPKKRDTYPVNAEEKYGELPALVLRFLPVVIVVVVGSTYDISFCCTTPGKRGGKIWSSRSLRLASTAVHL